ncbi:MAG: DNA primase [Saprospiraceae bacterium]|nr:MAG: DNA primase [Saprospiraceae bacterium]
MIDPKSVQEVLEVSRVEEVIQDFVNLKRRGVNYIGLCPFHNEKTPSFVVSPAKNIYKCFGCGQAGGPPQFLMEHEHLSFPEAIRQLAKKFGVKIEEKELTPEARQQQQEAESLYLVNQFAKEFYDDKLFNTDIGRSVGLNYFKERGYREETIKKFGLGFSLDSKDALTLAAVNKGYNLELLKKLGLTSQYDRDFFRSRVMFTIHNLSGKVIAFAGRIMVKDVKAPKYVNSPETEIYHKSKVLYGAYFAKQAIRKADECILVEGYTDVISLHQAGIENVVASSGTSLTVQQIKLIKRFTPNVKILYDGDFAGVKAAMRGVDLLLEQDMNVKIVLLPEGEDPDSYLSKVGISSFREYSEQQAKDFIMFKANMLKEEAGHDPIQRSNLIKEIVNSISLIPDPIKRSLYIKECAQIFEVPEQLLVGETNKSVTRKFKRTQQDKEIASRRAERTGEAIPESDVLLPAPSEKRVTSGDEFQERDIVRILMAFGGEVFDEEEKISVAEYILHNLEDVLEDFDNEFFQQIIKEVHQQLEQKQNISDQYFINHENEKISELAIGFLTSPYEFSANWAEKHDIHLSQKPPEQNFSIDSIEALKRFRLKKIINICEKNQEKIKELALQGKDEEVAAHMRVHQKLVEIRRELTDELKTVVPKGYNLR